MNKRLLMAMSLYGLLGAGVASKPEEEELTVPRMEPGQEFIVKIVMIGKRVGERRVHGTSQCGGFDQIVDESVLPRFIIDAFNALEGRTAGYFGAIMNDDGVTARILFHQPFNVDSPW